ncbi:MAG: undecaprenyl-diphosphate phosphatase [Eubacteriaceae bacterium]|jgi:undecaprenyl-diphosphatase|nr:undecaprenyl-diphosphate phosphatase [Eubacteriaceae bacterium]
MFIEILKTILFGIVQGVTEWLPVSSTGHMILLEQFFHLNVSKEFWDMFLVVIQFSSILAVVLLYAHRLNPFSPTKTAAQKKDTFELWKKVLVGILPAGITGVLFDDWLNQHLYSAPTVAFTLILYGVLFIVIENRNKKTKPVVNSISEMSLRNAIGVGLFQTLSLIPGTSRSGSTILGAMILGNSRTVATEFSFFMAIPIMLGASSLKLLKYFIKTGLGFTGTEVVILLTGLLVSFAVSVVTIRLLVSYVRKNDFKPFGYYRILLGVLVFVYFLSIH